MIDVLEIIASIEAEKKSRNIEPSYALMSEITNEVTKRIKAELNRAVADGRLSFNETINSIGFYTKT
jgi:hypothetical protein